MPPFLGLVDQPPVQDLLRCAKHLFVGARVAWVHLGPATNRQIRRQRGSPRWERFQGQSAAVDLEGFYALANAALGETPAAIHWDFVLSSLQEASGLPQMIVGWARSTAISANPAAARTWRI